MNDVHEVNEVHERRVARFYEAEMPRVLAGADGAPFNNLGLWTGSPGGFDEAGAALFARVADAAGIGVTDVVLDVGCGYGRSTVALREDRGCARVVGIDIAGAVCAYAQSWVSRRNLAGSVTIAQMSATALGFPAQTFTRVVAVDTACHFDPQDHFFTEAYRVLAPGGVLALADVVAGHSPRTLADRVAARWSRGFWNIPTANAYGPEEYADRLRAAGFTRVRVEPIGAEVLAGAARFVRSPAHRKQYRAQFGVTRALIHAAVFRVLGFAYRRGLVDYILVTAHRPGGPASS